MQTQAAGFRADLQGRDDLVVPTIQGPNARAHSSELVSPVHVVLTRGLKPFRDYAEGD